MTWINDARPYPFPLSQGEAVPRSGGVGVVGNDARPFRHLFWGEGPKKMPGDSGESPGNSFRLGGAGSAQGVKAESVGGDARKL